ncbi:hypothetical protein PoB_005641500 [Plakobranchus ocellatus]|uniref:Uncharacterized protein n=1 Tax=Plakobranchus ocellatus TaxID=259542 RepID=A0AAV4CEN1_9GAST|nr:hypothetical protein PoB_005641500 [Plakobranchus ocellatus]
MKNRLHPFVTLHDGRLKAACRPRADSSQYTIFSSSMLCPLSPFPFMRCRPPPDVKSGIARPTVLCERVASEVPLVRTSATSLSLSLALFFHPFLLLTDIVLSASPSPASSFFSLSSLRCWSDPKP